ncbi:DUF7218 family protein [Glutamicibacter sp.]|uniref:DUF7218 family protein n=1 Tax=Glutamicibacter sp. TaxID=1931995 RepID=UPI002FE42467
MPSTAKSTVKDEELYEELREKGNSKQKSARIANAAARHGCSAVGKRGGRSSDYEDWSVEDFQSRTTQIGIKGRSKMRKSELINALRNS